DFRPDLVLTSRCSDAATGVTKWLVHHNDGTGFATTPTDFTLPQGFVTADGSVPFAGLSGTLSCTGGANLPEYTVVDLNGDLRPDLVMFARCSDSLTGRTTWGLHRNTGSAFAIRETFALPSGYTVNAGLPFPAFSGRQDCSGGRLGWAALDMNGDLKPDLL